MVESEPELPDALKHNASGPDLPDELQNAQDRFYAEVMGSIDDMLFVAEWHSSSAVGITMIEGERLWCHLLNVAGSIGVGGKPVQLTIAIPLDSAARIGTNMIRVAHLSPEELERDGRVI